MWPFVTQRHDSSFIYVVACVSASVLLQLSDLLCGWTRSFPSTLCWAHWFLVDCVDTGLLDTCSGFTWNRHQEWHKDHGESHRVERIYQWVLSLGIEHGALNH